ncbi:MAG: hypothetical protein EOO44_06965 [Flavobacterium sp.]|nr:MAG: hypothetical protein EOO44_06965 [Flavobacterium sp.]
MDETPVWKTILGIIVAISLFIRVLYTCSNQNSYNPSNAVVNQNFEQSQAAMKEVFEKHKAINTIMSTKMMYSDYKALDSLSPEQKQNYGIVKLEKDSLVYIAIDAQLKVPKNYFLQNNHDQFLRVAFKSPDNFNFFIHDFESKEDVEESFKKLKSDSNLQKYKVENTIDQVKAVSYKITRENKRYNGYALCFKNAGVNSFYEFESGELSKDKLKMRAVDYLSQNMKAIK